MAKELDWLGFLELRGLWVTLTLKPRSQHEELLLWRVEDELDRLCFLSGLDWREGQEPAIH